MSTILGPLWINPCLPINCFAQSPARGAFDAAFFPLPAFPAPPCEPEPLWSSPQPQLLVPRYFVIFFLRLTVILDHPREQIIDFFLAVSKSTAVFEWKLDSLSAIALARRLE